MSDHHFSLVKSPSPALTGHLLALFTAVVWGCTFISTKFLLIGYRPIEILFIRFVIGLIALCIVSPKRLVHTSLREELYFAAAGLTGICLYYLLENIALTVTTASNISIILSTAPFFTGILASLLDREEKLSTTFYFGFIVSMIGIAIISLNGSRLELNPLGDLLALLAALVWAVYSILTKRIGSFGYDTILTTRRFFEYGLLFMLPALFFTDFHPNLTELLKPVYLYNYLFLGLVASAACFITWNTAVDLLGPVKTSAYIYLTPAITVVASFLFLNEPITPLLILGTVLTLSGLILSERKKKGEKKETYIDSERREA